MFLGLPAKTEKANISLSNENLNSQDQHLLHQHGKELCIFQLGLVKFCAFSLKEKKSIGGNGIARERLTLHTKNLPPSEFQRTFLHYCCPSGVSYAVVILKLVLESAPREVKSHNVVHISGVLGGIKP